jgi:hypothetical protein
MLRSTFELSVVDYTGQQNRVRWIFGLDGEDSAFADAVAEGCRRLNLDNNLDFVIYETLNFDDKNPKGRLLQQDEVVKPDKKYVIVERTVYDNITNHQSSSSSQFFSPSRQPPPTSIRQSPSTSIRQSPSTSIRQSSSTSSRQTPNHQNDDAEALIYNSSSTPRLSVLTRQSNNDPSLLVTPPHQPPVFHPSINSRHHESATLPVTSSMVLFNNLLSQINVSQTPPVIKIELSRTHRLTEYYLYNTSAVEAFESCTPRQPLVF